MEYNENDDNFKIFSIFSPTSVEDLVLRKFSKIGELGFGLGDYSHSLNALIYLANSKRRVIKTLHPDVKNILRKDFSKLANVLDK